MTQMYLVLGNCGSHCQARAKGFVPAFLQNPETYCPCFPIRQLLNRLSPLVESCLGPAHTLNYDFLQRADACHCLYYDRREPESVFHCVQ